MTRDYKILLDVPFEESEDLASRLALGFEELSTAFQEIIEFSEPQFAIGLFGGWGSGKTTLMRAIERRLNSESCATVWFSAWRYEKEEHLIIPLLDVIREGMVEWADKHARKRSKARESAFKAAGTVGKAITSLLAGFSLKAGIPDLLEISYDANQALTKANEYDAIERAARTPRSFYQASFSALKRAFSDFSNAGAERVVVFVDDLDRCLPQGALEVLESMKLFFDLRGFVFVVGVDRNIIEASVERRYSEINDFQLDEGSRKDRSTHGFGGRYLEKIFQVPFNLAPVSSSHLPRLLDSIHESTDIGAKQWKEINTDVRAHLDFLVGDDGGINPRQVKKFINAYTLVRKTAPNLDKNKILSLQTIAARADWLDVSLAILAYRGIFIDGLRKHMSPGESQIGAVIPELEALPKTFSEYVEAGAPGHVLLDAGFETDIDRYIFSSVGRSNSSGLAFVRLFMSFGEAMVLIRSAVQKDTAIVVITDAIAELVNQADEVSSALAGELSTFSNSIRGSRWDYFVPGGKESDPELSYDEREKELSRLAQAWEAKLRTFMSDALALYRP